MSEDKVAWTWRHAIIKSGLPSTTRHVLLTISCFMNDMGQGCYPTQEQLAEATGLSDRAVRGHLDIAEKAGWITRKEHGFKGQKWRNHEYVARWPDDKKVRNDVPDVRVEGAERDSSRKCEGAEPDDKKVRNDVPTTSPYTSPAAAAREKSDLESLTDRLLEAAGDKIQPHGAIVLAPILGLLDAGCDLETDILPTIRARCAKLKRPAGSWAYFVAPIREAYETRIEAGRGLAKPKAPPKRDDERTADELRDTWRKRLEFARPRDRWITWQWGPPPGQAGCRVPSDMLTERDVKRNWSEVREAEAA